ncbi:MAG: hypothetical protein CSA35_00150 [Dethiosulfovibrio peptidovorans]|nr:MAG: hypothetical protein CSA35_00150 [Dethiosulfovibrio peptidovorans]
MVMRRPISRFTNMPDFLQGGRSFIPRWEIEIRQESCRGSGKLELRAFNYSKGTSKNGFS